jgi:trehalose 6-phosphate synthase/phosphatase
MYSVVHALLFQFAGAAQSLGAGAIVVNPWDTAKVAKSINDALNMPADKREKRHRHNYGLVSAHSAQVWAEDYVR